MQQRVHRRVRLLVVLAALAALILPAVPAAAKPKQQPADIVLQSHTGTTWLHGPHQNVYTCESGGTWHFVLNQVSPSNHETGTITAVFSGGVVVEQADKVLRRVRHFTIEGTGTLITASVNIGGAKLVLSDFECDGEEPPEPLFCGDIEVAYLFEFSGQSLINRDPTDQRLEETLSGLSIPAGSYGVILRSFDDHSNKPGQNQLNERWRARFENGSAVYSDYIDDLPEAQDFLTQNVGQVTLTSTATSLTAEHWGLANGLTNTPESIIPICVGLNPVANT